MNENKQVGHSKQETKQLLDGVEQNIVICLWQADQLSIDLRDNDKSQYFAITVTFTHPTLNPSATPKI